MYEETAFLHMKTQKFMTCFSLLKTQRTSPLVISKAENSYWELATLKRGAISLYLWAVRYPTHTVGTVVLYTT
jgi:hypothetical protein